MKEPIAIELETNAKTIAFQRQRKQTARIMPVPMKIITDTQVSDKGQVTVEIEVIPDKDIVDLESVIINANTKDNTDRVVEYKVPQVSKGTWKLTITPSSSILQYHTVFHLKARTISSRYFEVKTTPMLIVVPNITMPKPEIIEVEKIVEVPVEGKVIEKAPTIDISGKKILAMIMLFLVCNVILAGGIILLMRVIKKKRMKEVEKMYAALNKE